MSVEFMSDEALKNMGWSCAALAAVAVLACAYLRYRRSQSITKAADARALKRLDLQSHK